MKFHQEKSIVIPVLLIILCLSYLGKSILVKTPAAKKTAIHKQDNPQILPTTNMQRARPTAQNRNYPRSPKSTYRYKIASQKRTTYRPTKMTYQPVKSKFKKSMTQSKHIPRKIPSRSFTSIKKPIYKLASQTVQTPEQLQELALEQQRVDQQRKADEIEYQKEQEKKFLSTDVGLPANQIEAVTQQNENFNQEIQSISATQPNRDLARAMVMEASSRHHTWMIQHLGFEVYNQLRNINSR